MLVTELNRGVPPAAEAEFAPLRIGSIPMPIPVVLAPMAGVTNAPFRVVCGRFAPALYVSEMITARGVCERNRRTLELVRFLPQERRRSLQLYGTQPSSLEHATRILIDEVGVEHLDFNLGCPVRKVTAAGGGAAIPLKPRLLGTLLRALVRGAGSVPVTVKMRLGIDDDRLTYMQAGRIAQAEGAVAVGLHARTAAQLYDGDARWDAIGELQAALEVPVLGNGDIWEAHDALRMMRHTACRGVIVGRGCLGRPWLLRELAALFRGEEPPDPPRFGEIAEIVLAHAALLVDFFGPKIGVFQMRKHAAWYTKSFHGGAALRPKVTRIRSLEELEAALEEIPPETPFPLAGLRVRRCKKSGRQRVVLPRRYLDSLPHGVPPPEEAVVDGG